MKTFDKTNNYLTSANIQKTQNIVVRQTILW